MTTLSACKILLASFVSGAPVRRRLCRAGSSVRWCRREIGWQQLHLQSRRYVQDSPRQSELSSLSRPATVPFSILKSLVENDFRRRQFLFNRPISRSSNQACPSHNPHLECTRGDQTRADDFEASSTVCFDIQSWRNGWKIERGLWFLQNKREAGNDCVLEAFASSKRLKHTAPLEDRNGNLYARHQDDG